MRYRFGTMGYSYADWQGPFYPANLGSSRWLADYATHFDAVEMNTTFHAAPTVNRIRGWLSKVGSGFQFAVKTPRAITHDQPFKDALAPMLDFTQTVKSFGPALGPVLIQLAPHISIEAFDDLDRLLARLPTDIRYAVEFRHDSWVQDRTTDLLRAHRAAWVGLDHLDHPHLRRLRLTTDFLYVRLVGRHGRFKTLNHEQVDVMPDLHRWHAAIRREVDRSAGNVLDVWLLASNDFAGHAPATLKRFAAIASIDLSAAPVQSELFK